ncbi:Protein CBR-CHAT-1 [Aphelenchoides fujianensis]|nr:Protein CBR-CHAT-1 [Aphelenchoides fujianensis]
MPPRRNAAGEDEPPRVAQPASSSEETRPQKNRPNPSRLRQQKLSAWQPILTAYTAIPAIFVTGLVFIPVGVVLLIAAESVKEWTFEYGSVCSRNDPRCTITVNITEPYNGNVYFYYQLENYFQNHRRYVKSRSDKQLLGDVSNVGGECAPYDYATINGQKYPIAPCGAIANSMFNDTFKLLKITENQRLNVPLTYEGVIWEVDRDTKFKNPVPKAGGNLCDAFQGTVKPPNWQKHPCELDTQDPENNGFQNVDFIVWMRTAALPSFRKLYRILDRNSAGYQDGLPAGTYQLEIMNYYPVEAFNGKKYFVISTTSWFGGKNKFLGVAYIIIGSVCVVLGAIFSFIHVKFGHTFAEMADITNNAPH